MQGDSDVIRDCVSAPLLPSLEKDPAMVKDKNNYHNPKKEMATRCSPSQNNEITADGAQGELVKNYTFEPETALLTLNSTNEAEPEEISQLVPQPDGTNMVPDHCDMRKDQKEFTSASTFLKNLNINESQGEIQDEEKDFSSTNSIASFAQTTASAEEKVEDIAIEAKNEDDVPTHGSKISDDEPSMGTSGHSMSLNHRACVSELLDVIFGPSTTLDQSASRLDRTMDRFVGREIALIYILEQRALDDKVPHPAKEIQGSTVMGAPSLRPVVTSDSENHTPKGDDRIAILSKAMGGKSEKKKKRTEKRKKKKKENDLVKAVK